MESLSTFLRNFWKKIPHPNKDNNVTEYQIKSQPNTPFELFSIIFTIKGVKTLNAKGDSTAVNVL